MTKLFLNAILISSLFILNSCAHTNTVVGKWEVLDKGKEVSIEIEEGGKCIGRERNRDKQGTWVKNEDGSIMIKFAGSKLKGILTEDDGLAISKISSGKSITLKRGN